MELKALNIHTVEALAAIPDSALSWLGARTRRDQAQKYLASAKDGAATIQMAAELAKRDADIEALKQQIAELGSKKKPAKEE
jgi:hypothetical protein